MLAWLLLLILPAAARDCPWEGDEITSASATMTTVTINGRTWSVRGRANRERFLGWLVACQHGEAARHFTTWRAARLGTNVSAVTLVGAVFYAPFSAAIAGMSRDDLVRALENDASQAPEERPDEERSQDRPGLVTTSPRPRVLTFYALGPARMVQADTPRREAPALAAHFDADWAPYHTVEPVDGVLETLAEVNDPEAAGLAGWLRGQDARWVGWHLERRDPDDPSKASVEALAEVPRSLVFYGLDGPDGAPVDDGPRLVLAPPYPSLAPLDPDVPPHLMISSRDWLRRHLSGPARAVDAVLEWMEDEEVSWVGWQWESESP